MAGYKPAVPFNVPLMLLKPQYGNSYGVDTKTYPAMSEGELVYGSFKTYGGTERTERDVDGIWAIEDTAIIECWYRPDIKSDCRIGVLVTGAIYEIWGEPENINLRNQYLRMKVRRYKGGA